MLWYSLKGINIIYVSIVLMTTKNASLAMDIEQFNIDNLYFSQRVEK